MKLIVFFLLSGILAFMAAAQENPSVPDRISRQLSRYQQLYPAEKIYIQSDKDVYAPGEIIWFSGMLINRTDQHFSAYNPDVIVSLFDGSGKMVSGDKYPVNGGKLAGDILLQDNIPLGRYYLAAFTPYQENPDIYYIKPVTVNRYYKGDITISPVNPEKVYEAGTKVNIDLKADDFNGKPADKFTVNYEVRHNGVTLSDGKARSEGGRIVIQAVLPQKTGKEPVEVLLNHPKNLWTRTFFLKTTADNINVKFYVEGGYLMGTLPQKTGIYATTWHDTPVFLEANVTGASGEIISKVRTFLPGFGLFPLQVKPGEKYKFTITSEYGKGQTFELPVAGEDHPVALTVARTDNEFIWADLLVKGNTPRKLTVTATQGHNLLWAAQLETAVNARIKIPYSELRPGIVQLSVFDDQALVQSSRLVFVPETSKADLQISDVTTENGNLKLTLKTQEENAGSVAAGLILTIADTMREQPGRNLIRQQLILNGELQNPVNDPSLLPEETTHKSLPLDYVLICNGLKGFSWDRIMALKEVNQGEAAENYTGISGNVYDKKGNSVPRAKVSVLNNRDMKLYKADADDKGHFRFQDYQPVNLKDITITASDENGKGNYRVVTDPVISEKISAKIKELNQVLAEAEFPVRNPVAYLKANPGQLVEPPIVKVQTAGESHPRIEPYKALLATATNLLDVIKSMKPYTLINGQIVFAGGINSINFQSGALIVIDNVKMGTSADVLNNIVPYDVDEIKISTDPIEIQRYTGLNNVGIIEITTKKGLSIQSSPVSAPPAEQLYREGVRVPRNFLTADALAGQPGKDFRTTLYWNPDLEIGATGTTTFSVPLSGINSGFVISAEGITSTGKIIKASRVIPVR